MSRPAELLLDLILLGLVILLAWRFPVVWIVLGVCLAITAVLMVW